MGQILTNELDKTSTNVATWHELKTKTRNDDEQQTTTRRKQNNNKEKGKKRRQKNPTKTKTKPQIPTEFHPPAKETERANEAKAILRTWLQGRAAGAVSPPASCGNARRTSRAVLGMRRRPARGRPADGPGPRWGSWQQAGRRACSQCSRRGRARMAAAS